MTLNRSLPAALLCLLPGAAWAQTSFIAPDGRNRFPAVTIFCPNGTGVIPCNFGSGGGGGAGGAVSLNQGGSAVSASNRLPVADTLLDGLINSGALSVAGTVSLAGTSALSLGAGGNAIGSVTVSNLPATQAVSGAVGQAGTWNVGLSAGGNAIGSVSVSNLPATQPISGAVGQAGAWNVGLSAGSNAIGSVTVSNLPATQPVSGSVAVSNLPALQAVSATALPLPAGAATSASQSATLAPIAPATGTATNATVIGCVANTTPPAFASGQQGAVPCDGFGRPYVVTVPSANNVPSYLQAVTSGGATIYRAINAAASAMAANIKSTSGMLYGYEACNSGTASAYLRLFALGTAPTIGTSVPVVTKLLPPNLCQNFSIDVGLVFPAGLAADVTSGSMADNDTATIATANQVSLEVYYK